MLTILLLLTIVNFQIQNDKNRFIARIGKLLIKCLDAPQWKSALQESNTFETRPTNKKICAQSEMHANGERVLGSLQIEE